MWCECGCECGSESVSESVRVSEDGGIELRGIYFNDPRNDV